MSKMAVSTNNMMTADEALAFVQNVLGMSSKPSNPNESPETFLQEFILAWMHHIPWQTVTGIATPHQDRHLPTVAEIKRDILARIGGLCYQHNFFCFLVLRALGFEASLVACDVVHPSDHVGLIVHNLTTQGSKHFVDVGIGMPILRAVPLDFNQNSPVYHDSFLRYKLARHDDVVYLFHWTEVHAFRADMEVLLEAERFKGEWCRFVTIHSGKSVDLSHFIPTITPTYTIADKNIFFLSSVRCMAFPDGRFVCIKDTTLLQENEPGRLSKTYLKSREEIKDAFERYFPQFNMALLDDALNDDFVQLDYGKGQNSNC